MSVLWVVDELPSLKADGHICNEAFWIGEEDFKKLPKEELIWGIRDDILTVFDLFKREQAVKGELNSWSWK